ncbi:MAG: TPM domain-containing protein [Clostridia bacterium]|nr:TPM domain-containing protein [Clostridia bacterium]
MKRTLSLLLIAILLLCPLFSARADDSAYIATDTYLFSSEATERLNARAEEIGQERGVAVYFFYMKAATDLIGFTKDYAVTNVAESDAIILGLNDTLYYFYAKGETAGKIFTESAKDALWTAFASITGDNEGKVRAYLDAADEMLEEYFAAGVVTATEEPTSEPTEEPTPAPTQMPPVSYTKDGKLTVVDSAGLLTAEQVTALSGRLAEIGEKYRCDVIVATVPSLGYKTAEEYADDFFDYNGYGYGAVPDENGTTINGDGILLLLSTEDRDFAVSTSGYGIKAFTDYGIQTDLEAAFLPYLRDNRWYEAFNAYADRCDWLLNTARKGKPYDVGYYLNGVAVAIAAIAGLLLAFIPVNAMKRQLTVVYEKKNADEYLTRDSFHLTQNTDLLLGTHTSRSVHVEPERSSGGGGFGGGSSTHTSSSGGTHGGHSGKF